MYTCIKKVRVSTCKYILVKSLWTSQFGSKLQIFVCSQKFSLSNLVEKRRCGMPGRFANAQGFCFWIPFRHPKNKTDGIHLNKPTDPLEWCLYIYQPCMNGPLDLYGEVLYGKYISWMCHEKNKLLVQKSGYTAIRLNHLQLVEHILWFQKRWYIDTLAMNQLVGRSKWHILR